MKISVKNVGNIKEANNININNLNLYIGKNGSGKTYFSKLIYFMNNLNYTMPVFLKLFKEKLSTSYQEEKSITFTIDDVDLFIQEFSYSIEKTFASKLGIDKFFFKNINIKLEIDEINVKDLKLKQDKKLDLDTYEMYMGFDFIRKILPSLDSFYLPAARANYMITYKYLIESQMNNYRLMSLKNKTNQKFDILPEIENIFLQNIYSVDTKKRGIYAKFAKAIEDELFQNGKLSIKNPKTQDVPTYEFKLNDSKKVLDLVGASSSVTEIAPLILYLRHIIMGYLDDCLFIDEPELSLHPSAQRILVDIIVRLVNSGLKVTLITHSPYIIEALNNNLLRYKIKDEKIPDNIKSITPLSCSLVSAYLFENNTIVDVLNKNEGLIDDKLIESFNDITKDYEVMRDIEYYKENTND
ncbi:MAG: hypothetical protein COA44_04950 [Arcobacter sp.]|nr:MAG: hypothetical protein COA44_04950 [Arcobacter sp.]